MPYLHAGLFSFDSLLRVTERERRRSVKSLTKEELISGYGQPGLYRVSIPLDRGNLRTPDLKGGKAGFLT